MISVLPYLWCELINEKKNFFERTNYWMRREFDFGGELSRGALNDMFEKNKHQF